MSEGRPLSNGSASRIVGRLVRRVRKPVGAAPGTLLHGGERKAESVLIRSLDYGPESFAEEQHESIEACFAQAESETVTWVNVDGLHEPDVLEAVGERFGIHRLALEDVLSTIQRPKSEAYEGHILIILRMLTFDEETLSVMSEQVSLVVGPTWLFSFQERRGDVFEPVRERLRQAKGRIRHRGTDYLAYALIDTIVDTYFKILERIGDRIEVLEEAALYDPSPEVREQIHHLRRELLVVRRAVWPLRESIGSLARGEIDRIGPEVEVFFRDVHDHAVQIIDTVETLREVLSATMDAYMTGISNRMNEVMKVLTIIATIFIPLSFFAGLYGMNFVWMPELQMRWGYPALLVFMAVMASGMIVYFKRRGWL